MKWNLPEEWNQAESGCGTVQSLLLQWDMIPPHKRHGFLDGQVPQSKQHLSPLSHHRQLDLYKNANKTALMKLQQSHQGIVITKSSLINQLIHAIRSWKKKKDRECCGSPDVKNLYPMHQRAPTNSLEFSNWIWFIKIWTQTIYSFIQETMVETSYQASRVCWLIMQIEPKPSNRTCVDQQRFHI